MVFDLSSISRGCGLRPPRIILLGVEKIGKSTFAAGSDKPIFLPIAGEEGIDSLDVPQFPAIEKYTDLVKCLMALYQEEHDYNTIVIDSASALEPIIWQRVCERCGNVKSIEEAGGGYAKGYTEALTEWTEITRALDVLRNDKDMASIIIGHVRVRRFDDPAGPSYDQYQFDLHEKAVNKLYRWADLILFANAKVAVKTEDTGFGKKKGKGIDVTGGQRFLFTGKRPAHPGGGRGVFGHLPYELPLSWTAFQDAVAKLT